MLDQTPQKEHFNTSMMLPSRNNLKTSFYRFFLHSQLLIAMWGPSINDVTMFSWLLPFFLLPHYLQCWASQKYTKKTVLIIGGFDFDWYYHSFFFYFFENDVTIQYTKGQLISKADWRTIDSCKKRTVECVLFAFLLFTANKSNSSFRFLGESTACQSAFWFHLTFNT